MSRGLVITISYDSSVATAPAGFKTAVAAAVAYFEAAISSPITVTIAVGFGEVAGAAMDGSAAVQSVTNFIDGSYAQVRAALPNAALPATDPTSGGVFSIADAQAKLWRMTPSGGFDGAIGLYNGDVYSYDPSNRAVGGAYDAIGAIEYGISAVLGRVGVLGSSFVNGVPVYTPLDLFRYAAPGQRQLTPGPGFFSLNGTTLLQTYNDPRNGGQAADWDPSLHGDAFTSPYPGSASQITAVDLQELAALGYTTVGASPSVPASITAAHASVVGVGGAVQTVAFDNTANAAMAQTLLTLFSNAEAGGGIVPALAAAAPSVPAGKYGLLQVNVGGLYAIGPGYEALVDNATASATIFGGTLDNEVIVAGSAGLAYSAGRGSGTIILGGGNNLISMNVGAGAQNVVAGGGDDTITALAGNHRIAGGLGRNLILAQGGNDAIASTGDDLISAPSGNATITAGTNAPVVFLGAGASQFNGGAGQATVVVGSAAATLTSAGQDQFWLEAGGGVVSSSSADTVIGGSGSATVNAGAGNDFVFAGSGNMNFVGGSGVSTILGAAAGSSTIAGGAGSMIAIAYGRTTFIDIAGASSGANTVAAFGGSLTVHGGAGSGVFLGGPAGDNVLIAGAGGDATLIGGGNGDLLAAGAAGNVAMQAGGGAETMSALGSNARVNFYTGPGDDLVLLGSGQEQLLVGTGNATIFGAANPSQYAGLQDLLAFTNGNHATVEIDRFTPGLQYISLIGFGAGELAHALATATTAAGSEQFTLSDGTRILFSNVSGITARSFV